MTSELRIISTAVDSRIYPVGDETRYTDLNMEVF